MQRTIIVGDVHGCLKELHNLLKKVNYKKNKDRLIFVGDLINRGPYSLEVLEFVENIRAETVRGNHEHFFLEYIRTGNYGLECFLKLKHQMGTKFKFWVEWLNQVPLFIEEENFLVVHGGLIPGKHPSQTSPSILTLIRTWDGINGEDLNNFLHPPWFELYKNPKLVVFGHWAKKGLVIRDNAIGLDTGCVYGKYLTAVILPERKILQVPSQSVYEPVVDKN